LCYPDAFKDWKPGLRLPRCRRCDATLHPEENHVCEGYVPKLPFDDMEDHIERMEEQRESVREEIIELHEERREEKRRNIFEELEEQDAEF